MNPLKIMKIGTSISYVSVLGVPLVWGILSYFGLLLVSVGAFTLYTWIYIVTWYSVVFVMAIRPLADIFPKQKYLRQLCLLRRAFGILSAMIIVTLLIDKWIGNPQSFFAFFTWSDWSWGYPLVARLSELSALLLLVTSNNISQKKLGKNWKRIQRLSYVYFVTGGILSMRYGDDYFVLISMIVVGILFVLAFLKKQGPKILSVVRVFQNRTTKLVSEK